MSPSKHLRAVVTERHDVTADLWIVRIRPEEKIVFAPGQYMTVGLPLENRLVERPYSVASAPEDPEIEFFLEVVPGGKLTPNLYEVPVGGEVAVRRDAKGRFGLDDGSGHPFHLMAATVTGVAPFVAMVRSLAAAADRGRRALPRIVLLHAASLSAELAYNRELAECACRRDWFRYIPTVSRPWLDPGWTGERGRIEDIARKYIDLFGLGPEVTSAYLCGNPHMIRNMEGVLQRAGFRPGSIREENYWPG